MPALHCRYRSRRFALRRLPAGPLGLWSCSANRGSWGSAHVVDKKLYLTRDLVDADFPPKDLKLPKPAPEPESPKQPTARVTRSKKKKAGEHVQVFKMRHRRKKGGFHSEFLRMWTLQYSPPFALSAFCACGCATPP